ncbi:hypothetical protein CAAN1_02S09296 [[Candida] anglica]|uniref:Oxidoreductase n=1 Tax=[Candida] anglica TaxID=148631 RepID=A0ABP0EBT5_9ASCO
MDREANSKINWERVSPDSLNLAGVNVAIVGGTGGLGRAISRFMTSRGANVTVVGQTFRDDDLKGIKFIKSDLSLLSESERVAKVLPVEKLSTIIFTTGIFAGPKREETPEGIERDMAVSYLNRFVMLRDMIPRLKPSKDNIKPRIFVMGYPGNGKLGEIDDLNSDKSYKSLATHMTTVAGNEALVIDTAIKHPEINIFGLNPGLVKTNIRDNFLGENTWKSRIVEFFIGKFSQNADTYARNITPLIVSPSIEKFSGAMFNNKGKSILASAGITDEYAQRFMVESAKLVARAKTA